VRLKGSWVDIALLSVAFIWGTNFAITKRALEEVHPLVFNAIRITFSLLFLLGVMLLVEKEPLSKVLPDKNKGAKILLMGFLGNFLFQMFFIFGVSWTTAGNAALFAATAPVWTVIVGWLRGSEEISSKVFMGILMTISGAAFIALYKNGGVTLSSSTLRGDVLILFSAMSWGSYTALCKPFLSSISPNRLALTTFIPAYPLLVIAAIPVWPEWATILSYDREMWFAILYSGVLSTGLAYLLWNMAIKKVGSAQTAIYGNVVPIIAILTGLFYLGEQIQVQQIVGGFIILLGLMIAR